MLLLFVHVLSQAGGMVGGGREREREKDLLKCKLHLSANRLGPQLSVGQHEQFLPSSQWVDKCYQTEGLLLGCGRFAGVLQSYHVLISPNLCSVYAES